MAHETRIPVTVFTGLLGSGKTTLLNTLLRPEPGAEAPRVAVVLNEEGIVALEHKLARHASDQGSVLASGCACCSVQGELVDVLRNLFMSALHRKIPVFSRVLIEASGMADPVPVMHALQYQAFLRERYVYDGSVCVIDADRGVGQGADQNGDQVGDLLRCRPEVERQVAGADLLVMSKADLVGPDRLLQMQQALRQANFQAPIYSSLALPSLDELLARVVLGTGAETDARRKDQGLFSRWA